MTIDPRSNGACIPHVERMEGDGVGCLERNNLTRCGGDNQIEGTGPMNIIHLDHARDGITNVDGLGATCPTLNDVEVVLDRLDDVQSTARSSMRNFCVLFRKRSIRRLGIDPSSFGGVLFQCRPSVVSFVPSKALKPIILIGVQVHQERLRKRKFRVSNMASIVLEPGRWYINRHRKTGKIVSACGFDGIDSEFIQPFPRVACRN
mmetsp:Transcript_9537/g.26725  ORF Transcript_9537/g.26725 Transcript_9537/m.26725 type:complete len:205 (-) Transcript_9537:1438-2052(-)